MAETARRASGQPVGCGKLNTNRPDVEFSSEWHARDFVCSVASHQFDTLGVGRAEAEPGPAFERECGPLNKREFSST
jgi:hypothetical protein